MSISPNMLLTLPVLNTTPDPTWSQDFLTDLSLIDQHNHTTGQGVQIPSNGININADLSFNNNNAALLRSARLVNQQAVLSLPTDLTCVYTKTGDLYYNNASGTPVQITSGGSVNVSGSGGFQGDYISSNAIAYYSSALNQFYYTNSTNTYSASKVGTLQIINSGGFVLTLSNSAQTANITYSFPNLPVAPSILTIDNAGNITNTSPDNATVQVVGGTLEVAPGGITATQLASGSVTTAKIAAQNITQNLLALRATGSTVAAGGIATAQMSSGSQSTTSTSRTALTGMSVTITTTGRPIFIGIQPYSTNFGSYIDSYFSLEPTNPASVTNGRAFLGVYNATSSADAIIWEAFIPAAGLGNIIWHFPLSYGATVPISAGTYTFNAYFAAADPGGFVTAAVGGALFGGIRDLMSSPTPNMSLILPTLDLTPDPTWSQDFLTDFNLIDSHSHIPGQGIAIPTAGLYINADLLFNANNGVNFRSVQLSNLTSTLSSVTDVGCFYTVLGNLFYNDTNGQQVQITSGTGVDVSGYGGFKGDYVTSGAIAYFDNTNNLYYYTDSSGNYSSAKIGLLELINLSRFVLTFENIAQTSNITYSFPDLPLSTQFLSIDSIGNISNVAPDNSTLVISGSVLEVPTNGISTSQLANNSITTTNFVVENVTQDKLALRSTGTTVGIGGIAIATMSSPSQTVTGTSRTAVTGLSVTITTTGRPLRILIQPYSTNFASYIDSYLNLNILTVSSTGYRGFLGLFNNTSSSDAIIWEVFVPGPSPFGAPQTWNFPLSFVGTVLVPAGTYTFSAYISTDVSSNFSVAIGGAQLIIYET